MTGQAEYAYDLFISYADADRAWVEGYLLDALTQVGVRYYSEAAFALGVPRLLEFERAIQQSQRTLLVLSPAYLAEGFSQFTDLLAQSYGLETATWPVIPLTLKPVELPPRLAMLTALDATDPDAWPAAIERLCETLQRPPPSPPPKPLCPYPGMKPFREADSERFFGRDEEVEELLRQLRKHPFLTVIGPSGSGKSSLVFAGLVPALRQSGLFSAGAGLPGPGGPLRDGSQWLVHSLRPGQAPMDTLTSALQGDLADPAQAVSELLATQPGARHLLLVVDQFEELFTQARDEQVEPFQQTLLRLVENLNCSVVLTVRADFYADLMTTSLWREVQAHRVEVLPLDEERLRQAIIRPAEDVGVFVETALVERLIADAANEPGILPFVQETLVLLWEKLERRYLPLSAYNALILSARSYRELGDMRLTGLQVAMAEHAEAALNALTPEQAAITHRIFLRLVQFGEGRADTRRQQSVAALRAVGDDPALFEGVLRHLTDNRLLTLSGEEGDPERQVDIAHEALISGWPTFQEWLTGRREAEQTRRRLEAKAAEWERLGRGSGGLLDEVELLEAEEWLSGPDAADLGYGETLPALVRASRAAIKQAQAEKEATRQRELAQAQALAEAERQRLETQAKGASRVRWLAGVLLLVGIIASALTIRQLSNSPVYTGWQRMISFEEYTGGTKYPLQLVITVSSTDPDMLYVSDQTAGGLYKSTDGGTSWSQIAVARLAELPVRAIAASQQTVYVTTPEDVFISDNGGAHWAPGNLLPANRPDQQPWAVAVNPNDPSQAYVGTQHAGLWVTPDRGVTWSPVATRNVGGDWIRAISTDGRNVVMATDGGLWISHDGAQSWQPFIGEPAVPATVLGLTMPAQSGRFLMALGEDGVGDADVSSDLWFPLPDHPPSSFINSVSAFGEAFYVGSEDGLLCNRFWTWAEIDWWRSRLGANVPCPSN